MLSSQLRNYVFILIVQPYLLGCTTNDQTGDSYLSVKDPFHETSARWYEGTVEQAFATAKSESKLVFLYWGARWCPPCNELKSNVFSKPQFAELMKDVIPVYLDGDFNYAQAWGELFEITAYPTMLLVTEDKKELMRLSESMNIDEFAQALKVGIEQKLDFTSLIGLALKGQARETQWRLLAQYAWSNPRKVDLNSEAILSQRLQLYTSIPANLKEEKALLGARLLESLASNTEPDSLLRQNLRKESASIIANMLADETNIYATRSTLVYGAKGILNWSFPTDKKKRNLMWDKWIISLQRLRNDPKISSEIKLWMVYPEIQYFRELNPTAKEVPSALREKVLSSVREARENVKTAAEKLSLLPGAADILAEALLIDDAYDLLETESEESKAPYYFYANLARIAEKTGDQERAQLYSNKAAAKAEGRATRLQWLVNDVRLWRQYGAEKKHQKKIQKTIENFYEILFTMKDGFSGRAYRSVHKLQDQLDSKILKANPKIRTSIKNYSFRCHKLEKKDKIRCDTHFKALI